MQNKRRQLPCFVLALAGLVLSFPGVAAPFFSAETSFGPVDTGMGGASSTGGTNSIDAFVIDNRSGSARSGPGFVGASADAYMWRSGASAGDLSLNVFSRAIMQIDDVVFHGPSGQSEVSTSLNLYANGSIETAAANFLAAPDPRVRAGGSSNFTFRLSQGFFSANSFGDVTVTNEVSPSVIKQVRANGVYGDHSSDNATGYNPICIGSCFTTQTFDVELEVPYTLYMEITANAGVMIDGDVFAEGSSQAHYLDTISFPQFGSVFNLPAGYSVDSLQGLIDDNRWTGAPIRAVPEPATLALLAAAVAGLGFRRRREPSTGGRVPLYTDRMS